VNKLQKQLSELRDEKSKLEKKLEDESRSASGKSFQDLTTEVRILREKTISKDNIISQQMQQNNKLREEVRSLKQDVFIWQQKVFREKEKLDSITQTTVQLEATREIDLEKLSATYLPSSKHARERSLSSPVYPVFDQNGNVSSVSTVPLSPTTPTSAPGRAFRSNSQSKDELKS